MKINLYHNSLTCGGSCFYDAEAQRQMSTSGRSITRPAATEATTITVPLTELELEHYLETQGPCTHWFDGVMDALRQSLDPHIVWVDKDHINKEATMKRLQEANWGSEIKKQVATRQKYIERAVDGLRKEHGEQITTLQSMVADLLEENAMQRRAYESRTASLEKTVSDLTKRLFPLESVRTNEVPSRVLGKVITATPRNILESQSACSISTPLPPSPPSTRRPSVAKETTPVPISINRNDKYAQQALRLREARMNRESTAMEQRSLYN